MSLKSKIANSKFLKNFKNIYLLSTAVFLAWIFFFDSNSILVNIKLSKEINELEKRKKELQNQIDIDKKIISSLNNPDSLERYAREKLFMKKQNEDIYIIEFKD